MKLWEAIKQVQENGEIVKSFFKEHDGAYQCVIHKTSYGIEIQYKNRAIEIEQINDWQTGSEDDVR